MLSIKAFEGGLDSIETTYASKKFSVKYNERQYQQWYKLLKILSDEAYINAVDEWCINHNTLPVPSDILENANRLRPQDNSVNMPKNKEKCVYCGDTGFVSFGKKSEKANRYYEYFACCICEMGEFAHTQYPFPQARMDKLSMMENVPEQKTEPPKADINKLIEQFSMF